MKHENIYTGKSNMWPSLFAMAHSLYPLVAFFIFFDNKFFSAQYCCNGAEHEYWAKAAGKADG
jgi:hypothetical protein